jgi:hypothetical protein
VFSSAEHFAVSILSESQVDLSSLFASKVPDKFDRVTWQEGPAGSPIIPGAAAWFDCLPHDVIDAGDHFILLGRITAFEHSPFSPLGYYRGAHVTFGPSPAVLAATGERTVVGAILERSGAIVLVRRQDGTYQLPCGTDLGTADNPASLVARMKQLGIEATLNFLFAVFENPASRAHGAISIYYRGILEKSLPLESQAFLIPFDSIPWSSVGDDAVRAMLRRYVRERSQDTFGIYVGNSETGVVQNLTTEAAQEVSQQPS